MGEIPFRLQASCLSVDMCVVIVLGDHMGLLKNNLCIAPRNTTG